MYVFPRFVVLPEHAPKGFVPYGRMFTPDTAADGSETSAENVVIQGLVTSISAHSVTYLSPAPSYDGVSDAGHALSPEHGRERGVVEHKLEFEYLIYALGAGLPGPCDVWGEPPAAPSAQRGSKAGGIGWMQQRHGALKAAASVAVIGGGALGIQFASDIKDAWPEKRVTLVHSRQVLMPIYEGLHDVVVKRLQELGVEVILGERVMQWPREGDTVKKIRTAGGREVEADVVLACTGQRPRVGLLAGLANVDPVSGRIRVKPSMQVEPLSPASAPSGGEDGEELAEKMAGLDVQDTGLGHMFAIGDCAHTAAIQAGHTAYFMGEVAARNVVKLIAASSASAQANGDSKTNGPKANDKANGERDGSAAVAAKLTSDATQPVTYRGVELESYAPGLPAIKLTLGLAHYATHLAGELSEGADGAADLGARLMWAPLNAGDMPDDA